MRKTKIIATIGPSCIEYKKMKALVDAGVDIVRINLSHAKLEDMNKIKENVEQIRQEKCIPLPIMLDTRGPELRVGTFHNGSVNIKRGQAFTFTGRKLIGDENIVSINIPKIVSNIKPGDKILAVNGLMSFVVVELNGKDIITKAQNSGILSNRKSLFVPAVKMSIKYLNDEDKQDILWGIKNNVNLIATSFVNSKQDVIDLKKFISSNGGDMKIISKIESKLGINNFNEILQVSDGIMVARGDLGVELPMEKLPYLQKQLIKKTISAGKIAVTATEMLESMITNVRPTRAEVSDVANAVYDYSSCVMLSGESAMGAHPIEAVKMMAKIAEETEKHIDYQTNFSLIKQNKKEQVDVLAHSAVNASFRQKAKAIIVMTRSGRTVQSLSKYSPNTPIVAVTPCKTAYQQMAMISGVYPVLAKQAKSIDQLVDMANQIAKQQKIAKVGDCVIIAYGQTYNDSCADLIKIHKIY